MGPTAEEIRYDDLIHEFINTGDNTRSMTRPPPTLLYSHIILLLERVSNVRSFFL